MDLSRVYTSPCAVSCVVIRGVGRVTIRYHNHKLFADIIAHLLPLTSEAVKQGYFGVLAEIIAHLLPLGEFLGDGLYFGVLPIGEIFR